VDAVKSTSDTLASEISRPVSGSTTAGIVHGRVLVVGVAPIARKAG
jgi:hypothetical protein